MPRTAQVVTLPVPQCAERQLDALFAEIDALELQLHYLRARTRPLLQQVSADRGYRVVLTRAQFKRLAR